MKRKEKKRKENSPSSVRKLLSSPYKTRSFSFYSLEHSKSFSTSHSSIPVSKLPLQLTGKFQLPFCSSTMIKSCSCPCFRYHKTTSTRNHSSSESLSFFPNHSSFELSSSPKVIDLYSLVASETNDKKLKASKEENLTSLISKFHHLMNSRFHSTCEDFNFVITSSSSIIPKY